MEQATNSPQKITPFLWFDNQAEEAMHFYTSIFKNSKINSVVRNGAGGVLTASFTLNGQDFVALNGGPLYKFTEAISFVVNCETQDEIDSMWEQLSAGGEPGRCGWLKDKYGLSWQVVPPVLPKLLQHPDPEKSIRVMQAMMQMSKIDIPALIRAAEAEPAKTT
ncbi:VOC family protein [Adhaeribacter swui]|uniref:VOC family protein n=1 Tax=Adhaeribacter swui TaxID=2086471 RepID=A0A7G7GA06_9BACT|nr:VOC family protein [Adhaeribacter swui]QNF33990.1 VOC family protein [Adhaeribacter swui]